MKHNAEIVHLYGVVTVHCHCGWTATMDTREAAKAEHELHKRSEARKVRK